MFARRACMVLVSWTTLGAHMLAAQRPADDEQPWSGAGFFTFGWQRLDLDALNERLRAAALPVLPENQLTLGGSGWAKRSPFLIGGGGQALVGADEFTMDGRFRARLAGGLGQFDLGYLVHSGEHLDVYPIVGVGAGAVTLDVVEQGNATFDDILADPRTGTQLSAWGLLLDLSAAADVRITLAEEEGDAGGFALGVRAGYAYSPADWRWTDVPGGPSFAFRGPYVRVMVGGWGR